MRTFYILYTNTHLQLTSHRRQLLLLLFSASLCDIIFMGYFPQLITAGRKCRLDFPFSVPVVSFSEYKSRAMVSPVKTVADRLPEGFGFLYVKNRREHSALKEDATCFFLPPCFDYFSMCEGLDTGTLRTQGRGSVVCYNPAVKAAVALANAKQTVTWGVLHSTSMHQPRLNPSSEGGGKE